MDNAVFRNRIALCGDRNDRLTVGLIGVIEYVMRGRITVGADVGIFFVVLTSDNPRKEDPQSIIDSVKGYFEDKNIPYIAEVDRRKAINIALDMLQYNETLILCGKGHEDYQVLNGITVYLDEHEIVAKFMDKYNKGK